MSEADDFREYSKLRRKRRREYIKKDKRKSKFKDIKPFRNKKGRRENDWYEDDHSG